MNLLVPLLVAATTSIGGWIALVLNLQQTKKQREKDARAEELERVRSKQSQDSQTWYRESRHHYDVAKREAIEAKQECADCAKELRKTRNAIYLLLEDLEDQVLPMLMLADGDPAQIRVTMRTTIKKARDAL